MGKAIDKEMLGMMQKECSQENGVIYTRNSKLAETLGWVKYHYFSISLMSFTSTAVKPIKDHIFTANPQDAVVIINEWNKTNKHFKYYV
jgi:hypothetical protein